MSTPSYSANLTTDLYNAIQQRDLEAAKQAIAMGANVNFRDESNYSLLYHCVWAGRDFVTLLLDHGAKLDMTNQRASPVTIASLSKQFDVVKMLVQKFPESCKELMQTYGSYQIAIRNQDRESVRELSKIFEEQGLISKNYPLHKSIDEHDVQKIQEALSQAQEQVNSKDDAGFTPIHLAVLNDQPNIIRLLLENGADPYAQTSNGQTAFDLANQKSKPHLIAALDGVELPATIPDPAKPNAKYISWDKLQILANELYYNPYLRSSEYQKINLATLLKINGYEPVLKDMNLTYFPQIQSFDLSGMDFLNCHLNGRYEGIHFQGKIKDSVFRGFECKDCQFDPGTVIQDTIFKDSLFNHANFDQVTLDRSYFFYTGFKDTNLSDVTLAHDYFYGTQIWHVNFENLTSHETQLVETDLHEVLGFNTPLDEVVRTKPIIGIIGEVSELSDFSNPGFYAAEPYLRIVQSGSLPYLMSRNYIYEKIDMNSLGNEIDHAISQIGTDLQDKSMAQRVLEFDLPQIKLVNEIAQDYAQHLDGLWVPGGPDVYPLFYGKSVPITEEWGHSEEYWNYSKNKAMIEFALVDQMVQAGKPVLGVCHGAQLVNVYLGGTLIQHVPGHNGVMQELQILKSDGVMGNVLQGNKVWGFSNHHQAMDSIAPPLEKVAEYNGVTKAAQGKEMPIWLTQFHPEYLLDDNNARLLNAFFDAAKKQYESTLMPSEPIALNDVLSFESNDVLHNTALPQSDVSVPYQPVEQHEIVTQHQEVVWA